MLEQPSLLNMFLTTTFILVISVNVIKLYREAKGTWSLASLLVLSVTFFVTITIPTLIAIPLFWIYKQIIRLYFKIKFGSKFIGLIEGSDVINALHDKKDSTIIALFIYEVSEEKTPAEVYKTVEKMIQKHYLDNKDKLNKFHCTLQKCGGYLCMLKQDVRKDECVRKLQAVDNKEEITKEELITLINDCQQVNFLKNNELLWDIFIGTQHVKWHAKTGVKFYPVVFRFHHAICDGFSFMQFIMGLTADKSNDKTNTREVFLSKIKDPPLWSIVADHIMLFLYSVIYSPTMLATELVLNKKKANILYGPKLNKVSILTEKVDDGEYFKKIKYIKSCVPGCSFSDILFAALSYSLDQHFQEHSPSQQNYLHLAVPFLRKAMYLPQIPIGSLTVDDISLYNTFYLLNLKLPLNIANKKQLPLQERLKEVQKQTKYMATSPTNKVLQFATHLILQFLPIKLLKFVMHTMEWAAIVSFVPSPTTATMGDGVLHLNNIIAWIPRMKGIGCTFALITYGSKLQFGFNVDSALIPNQKDAQKVLDRMFTFLDMLENEINLNQ